MTTSRNKIQITQRGEHALSSQLGPDSHLRIAFAGGCGAFGYRIGEARRTYPGDEIIEVGGGLRVSMDARSARDLDGATIDFEPDQGFILDHPLAGRGTC